MKLDVDATTDEFLDVLLKDKTPEEQIRILRSCFDHAVDHPWTDNDLKNCIYKNICNEFNIEYHNQDEEDE